LCTHSLSSRLLYVAVSLTQLSSRFLLELTRVFKSCGQWRIQRGVKGGMPPPPLVAWQYNAHGFNVSYELVNLSFIISGPENGHVWQLHQYCENGLQTENKSQEIHHRHSKRCKIMRKMHQNTFGGRALPRPAGEALVLPQTP